MTAASPAKTFARSLEALRADHLHRSLRAVGTPQGPSIALVGDATLNFASNDYLGLANHPAVVAAAMDALRAFGAGSGASRLLAGSLQPHLELEGRLAEFKRTEAALLFNSGYAAATGCVQAIVGKGDTVVLDRLSHACLLDGARLSGATLRVFPHNDMDRLESILARVRSSSGGGPNNGNLPRILVVTESVFSMDGDLCPLPEIVALKEKYGAWLLLDDAHATGVLGENGRGWAHQCGLADRVDFHMGTLGKALGSAGGYLCGSRDSIDYLINRARSFIFSTAPPPSQSAAAMEALAIASGPEGDNLRSTLLSHISALAAAPPTTAPARCFQTPIIPVLLGEETRALRVESELRQRGVWVPAIRYPTVKRGSARLRISLSAAHRPEHIAALADALGAIL